MDTLLEWRVARQLRRQSQRPALHPGLRLREDLGLDGRARHEMVRSLERRFDIDIPDFLVAGLHTVADVQRCVAALLPAPKATY